MLFKNSITLIFIIILSSCVAKKPSETKKAATPPNIIFIFADDWGYGDLGCYGNTEVATPNIDKLAKEGTMFTQFHTTSGVCSPSRSSVITGHFPARHRVHGHFAGSGRNVKRGMPNWLDETLPVYLPRTLQNAGYTTAHFGKWHLGGGGLPHGDTTAPEPKVYGYNETRVWNGNGPTWKGDQHFPTTRYMDDDTLWVQSSSKLAINETIDFLERQKNDDAPIFVNLWLKDPHTPLWPSEEQKQPYKGLEPSKEIYYSVLTDADFHIGRLMAYLKKMNLDENTLVIFTSDNGPAGYGPSKIAGSTAGLKGRKTDTFQGGVNVPFIVRWKGKVAAGKTDNKSVLSTVDLLPTFSALANKKLPSTYKADGENVATIFNNKSFKRTTPLFWDWRFSHNRKSNKNHWVAQAVRFGDWKLMVDKNYKRVELYDIPNDRFEQNNLAEANPDTVKKLSAMLKKWDSELPK